MPLIAWALLLVAAALPLPARADPFQDFQLKPPTLSAPGRGSVVGHLANADFGPADVSRGTFSLPAPLSAPEEHGAIGLNIFPTYSPDSGLSEWGYGWKSSLSLERYRALGDLDYASDDLRSPWGVMRRGTDGYFYPTGLRTPVRVAIDGPNAVAYLPDGSRWYFGEAQTARIETAAGVYAWYVTRVVSAVGRQTSLTYRRNTSGRPYLIEAAYGGVDPLYPLNRLTVSYDRSSSVRDYRSGEGRSHDKQVKQVSATVRQSDGSWVERFRFDLTYRVASRGAGFYLSEINKTFVSGPSPTTRTLARYTYSLAEDHLARVRAERVPKTDALYYRYGPLIAQSDKSSTVDFDEDGLVDFEIPSDEQSFRQTLTGFESQPSLASPTPGQFEPRCRPGPSMYAAPRMLVRMLPGSTEPHVVIFSQNIPLATTEITVCTREGNLVSSQVLSGYWAPSGYVVLADVDGDQLPDIVRAEAGRIFVLHNASTATQLIYTEGALTFRSPIVDAQEAWVVDANGDGKADVITRYDSVFRVHHGVGRNRFDENGQLYQLVNKDGFAVSDFETTRLTFLDANKDGLVDLLRRTEVSTALYLSDGRGFFWETGAPTITTIGGWGSNYVAPLNLSGSGNFEVFFNKDNMGYAVALDQPETGLLTAADDTRGTVLRFSFERVAPTAGARRRDVVLKSLAKESSGNDRLDTLYSYGQPVFHPTARFLLGYTNVSKTTAATTENASFYHDENEAGLLVGRTIIDPRTPGIVRYQQHTFDTATFQGLPWQRAKIDRSGWASGTASLEEYTEHLGYEADFCPSLTAHHSAQGILTTEIRRAVISDLSQHLHCLDDRQVFTGTHADASLDFRYEALLTRNRAGLLTKLESVSPSGILTLQDVTYQADFRLDQISIPGRGVTRFEFEPGDALLRRVIVPDGSELDVSQRDPVSSAVLSLSTRNGSQLYSEFFRFDGEERLAKQWNSLGNTSEATPSMTLAYEYSTALEPAAVHVNTLVRAATGTSRNTIEWSTAAGEALATATRIPAGWAFGPLTQYRKSLLEVRRYTRATEAATLALEHLTNDQLLANAELVGASRQAGFGHETDAMSRLHVDVERNINSALTLTPAALEMRAVENGTYATLRQLDATQRLLAFEDEAGTRFTYAYDALGRLRSVQLPDGAFHRVTFDGHGRAVRVEREGVATVEYEHDASTGLLRSQRFLSPAGVGQRSEEWSYDGIGRKTFELHTNLLTGETQFYRWYYDGATPEAPLQRTHFGVVSAVEGAGYSKRFEYRADGKTVRRSLRLDGWRTIESELSYADDGALERQATSVFGADGLLLSSSSTEQQWDASGRISGINLNGAPLAAFGYDVNGQLSSATLPNGEWMAFGYDGLTRARTSLSQTAIRWSTATSLHFNDRGLLGSEDFVIGSTSLKRLYAYSPQQFLTSASDALHAYGYAFDRSGLPTAIEEQGVRKDQIRYGQTLVAGDVSYTFDDLGRTVTKGDLSFSYGPNGQVARVVRGGQEWSFIYDEAGQRLLKQNASGPVAGYLEGGSYVDVSGLSEPLHIGSQLAGIVKAGTFEMQAADARGTVMAENDGTPRLASPFGTRDIRPEKSAVVDYVEKGFDSDLGLIRMGVRDYDPNLNRFLTPDPLFLEQPELCLSRPVECNLYGYANNNPTGNIDPSGMVVDTVWDAANVGMGIRSIASWDTSTTTFEKVQDVVGLTLDVAAMALPFVPGGAGAALKGYRAADRALDGLKSADKAMDAAKAIDKATDTAKAVDKASDAAKGASGGPRAGKDFTPAGKKQMDAKNAEMNGGSNKCDNCGIDLVPGQRSEKGVSPPMNQRERDHIIPKSKGGDGSPPNGQILCRGCNLDKSDSMP